MRSEGLARALDPRQIERFAQDGFLFPFRILGREAADAARERVLALRRRHRADPWLEDYLGYKSNLVLRWLDDIVHEPRLLDAVADLLGPDLLLWSCSFVIKPPRSAGRYTWHQDATYWGLEPPAGLSVWLALGDVEPENGGLRCIPGGHAKGQLPHVDTFARDVMLPRGQEIADFEEAGRAVDLRLASGEVSFHHLFTPHASGPNHRAAHRIGCSMVFIPPSVRPQGGRESAMRVRGRDDYGHFEDEPRPLADLDPVARVAHHAAMTRMGTYRVEQRLSDRA